MQILDILQVDLKTKKSSFYSNKNQGEESDSVSIPVVSSFVLKLF